MGWIYRSISAIYSLHTQFGFVEHLESLPSSKPGACPFCEYFPMTRSRMNEKHTSMENIITKVFIIPTILGLAI